MGGSVYTPRCVFSWRFCGSNTLKRRLTVTSSKHVHLSPDVCAMSSQEPHFRLKSLGFPSCLLRLHSLLLLFTLLFLSAGSSVIFKFIPLSPTVPHCFYTDATQDSPHGRHLDIYPASSFATSRQFSDMASPLILQLTPLPHFWGALTWPSQNSPQMLHHL